MKRKEGREVKKKGGREVEGSEEARVGRRAFNLIRMHHSIQILAAPKKKNNVE